MVDYLHCFFWDVFALFDKAFGVIHYWEMQTSDYEYARKMLSHYIERLIYYFEDAPLSESKKNIEIMQRCIEDVNKSLRDINFKPKKLLETITHHTLLIFMDGWDRYCDSGFLNPSKKDYFDITSSEIRHLLYKFDFGEHFLWDDFFLVLEIKHGKVQVSLDAVSLDMRRFHEEEFKERKKIL
jgi:hypothetical protein